MFCWSWDLREATTCYFRHGPSHAVSLKHTRNPIQCIWCHLTWLTNFQVYLNPAKSHIQVCCDGKLCEHFKTFGFDWKEKFLKGILQRLLQISTIKTTFLEHSLKSIIWRPEVSRPTSVSKLKVLLCTPVSRWCAHGLCCLLVEAQKNPSESVGVGWLTDYNRILIKPRLQYWISGSSTENIQLMIHLPTFPSLIYLQCLQSMITLWPPIWLQVQPVREH